MKKKIFRNKNNIKFVIAFLFGLIITLSLGYATAPLFDSIYVLYNNTNSGMASNTVQAAIDELDTKCGRCPVGKECFDYTNLEGNEFYQKFAINGYKKLKYVDQPTSVANFYIDTGIAAADDVGVYINYSELASSGTYIFGTSGYVYTRGSTGSRPTIYNKKVYWNGNVIYQEDSNNSLNKDQIQVYWNYMNSRYVNHDQTRTDIPAALGSSYTENLLIFNKNDGNGTASGNNSAAIRLFEFTVTKGQNVVRRYLPCINSSNTPGLCELVTGTFSSGSIANKLYAGPVADERASDRFKVGDYVSMKAKYYCDSQTIPESITGYPADQSLCTNHNKQYTWRVLNINPDRTVDLILDGVSENGIAFGGVTGYKYYIDTLNYISGFYSNPVYTTRYRSFGFAETYTVDSRKFYQKPLLDTTESGPQWWNTTTGMCLSTELIPVGQSSDLVYESMTNTSYLKSLVDYGGGDYGWKRDVDLVLNSLGTILATQSHDVTYYIASRYFDNDTNTVCKLRLKAVVEYWESYTAFFDILTVTNNSPIAYDGYPGARVRPIVTLYSTVIPLSGTGTSADPYIIN